MDVFYVVSKSSPSDKEYVEAMVFNSQHKEADNESAANDYLNEVQSRVPWQTHMVVSESDFKAATTKPTPSK